MNRSNTAHDTFVIERSYDAPREQVFKAWSEPTLKARWFAGSSDALGAGYELDFRVGGRERNRGGPPGGAVYTYDAEIRDIVAGERIVYTYEMYADDARLSVSVATVEFRADGDRTHLVLTEQGVFLDGRDSSAQREEGTRSFLASLGAELDRTAA
jgi:uncharacterized protein YndB with AHSA1/START domain